MGTFKSSSSLLAHSAASTSTTTTTTTTTMSCRKASKTRRPKMMRGGRAISLPETGQSSKTISEFNSLLEQNEFLFIVYFRVHKCPYCCSYLRTLQALTGAVRAQGGLPLAITSQPAEFLPQTRQNSGYTGRVLVDTRNLVALELRKSGLLNVAISRGGYAQPAVLVLRRSSSSSSFSSSSIFSSAATTSTTTAAAASLRTNSSFSSTSSSSSSSSSSCSSSSSTCTSATSTSSSSTITNNHHHDNYESCQKQQHAYAMQEKEEKEEDNDDDDDDDEEVLYSWATKPVLKNMFGTKDRPSLMQIWENIDAVLHGRPRVHSDMDIKVHKFRTAIRDKILSSTRPFIA